MTRYSTLPCSGRRMKHVAVPCPGCINRAQWIPVPDTDHPQTLPDDYAWQSHQPDPQTVFFSHTDPKRATFKRVYDLTAGTSSLFKRNPAHINMTAKGTQCSQCADLEEGAY